MILSYIKMIHTKQAKIRNLSQRCKGITIPPEIKLHAKEEVIIFYDDDFFLIVPKWMSSLDRDLLDKAIQSGKK